MTTLSIAPVAIAPSEALDAIASSAIGRGDGSAIPDPGPMAFERVLAAETYARGLGAAADPGDSGSGNAAPEPRQTGQLDVPGATDPQPDEGRDDQHAVGRTRSHRGRDAAAASQADGIATDETTLDDATSPDQPQATARGQAAAVAGTQGCADAKVQDQAIDSTGAVAAGKSRRRHAETSGDLAAADPTAVAAAVLTPVVTGTQPDAKAGAAGRAADGARSGNAHAATPATPASPAVPAGKAPDGVAVAAAPASPAVPAHKVDGPDVATPVLVTPEDPGVLRPAARSAVTTDSPAGTPGPVGGEPAPAAPAGAIAASPANAASASPAGTASASPAAGDSVASPVGAGTGQASAASASAAVEIVSATGADPAVRARPDTRNRAAAVAKSGTAGRAEAAQADHNPELPTTASDVARARASIARIVAAGADVAVDSRHHEAAVPAANIVPAAPTADAALAAIEAARQATPTASSPAITTPPATEAAPAADRVAFEALDRIRTTVTAGVPGLESRIEDPELGTIRIVVSARLGETITAEVVARDPAAARELASGIDRALAAGASLPGNVDLRVRAEAATAPPRPDGHLGQGGGEHARPQDQPASGGAFGGRPDGGADRPPVPDAERTAAIRAAAPAPSHGRGHGPDAIAVAGSSNAGALRPGIALDVRA